MQRLSRASRVALVALAFSLVLHAILACASPGAPATGGPRDPVTAFDEVARVLRHPRCLNCHPAGDHPHVGDDRRRHAMNVMRGPDDRGLPGMHCASCHQPINQTLAVIPGAPHWQLAPRSMGWEDLDDHDLANALKDPEKNGGRTLAQMLAHMTEDPLVLWGWDPGPGREAVPIPHEDFVRALTVWIEGGAPSPPRDATAGGNSF
jgi:hypothetical protein